VNDRELWDERKLLSYKLLCRRWPKCHAYPRFRLGKVCVDPAAVREALRGQTYVTPMIAGELLQSYREGGPGPQDSRHRLTARQREVLQLIAEGRSAKEVAAVLKISIRTAEAHKARILEALRLRTTADLVQYAIRNGIITV